MSAGATRVANVSALRADEQWAAACLAQELRGADVRQHDDGSASGMYDLNVYCGGQLVAAVEVTAAADSGAIELWKLVNDAGTRWIEPELDGGWTVSVRSSARAKKLKTELPRLLRRLESVGSREISRKERDLEVRDLASNLGVARAHQGGTSFPGSIYVTIDLPADRVGGFVAPTGDALSAWVGEWMTRPDQAHNLDKLRASQALERHVFLILPGFANAPFSVSDLLLRPDAPSPSIPPTLPTGITGVWVMSTWSSGHGHRWSRPTGWKRFSKLVNEGEVRL
jgi:hypothetical protein